MAYSSTDISGATADGGYAGNDKPFFLAKNAIRDGIVAAQWSEGTEDFVSGTDRSLSTHPVSRCYDGFHHSVTKPDTSAVTSDVWTLMFELDGTIDIDCAFLLGHNLNTIRPADPDDITVDVQIADDNTFATNLITIAAWGVDDSFTTNARLGWHILDASLPRTTPLRYSGVQYLRLIFTDTSAADIVPEVGEFWAGRRRQLKHKAEYPFNDFRKRSGFEDFIPGSGIRKRYTRNRGQTIFEPLFRTGDSDEVSALEEMYRDCHHGTRPVVYVEDPETSLAISEPSTFWVHHIQDEEILIDRLGPHEREISFTLEELAPFQELER